FESRDLADAIAEGARISLDSAQGSITVEGLDRKFSISPIPPFMEQLIADGGLMKHIAGK
ncbi:MAG TPA: 3-isopropylmalate dehydratase small subunit, partial [Smithellaceae bacterium]|nr:3-isopropylmalate dehydratase small subunit [Smithellaceae bacterium]